MNTSQLEFGRAKHFLEYQHKIITNTITPTWITSIQSNAVAKSLLSIHGGWTPPKQREGDIHIGDLSEYTEMELSTHDLRLFHQTFQALQVTTLADIVDACQKEGSFGHFKPPFCSRSSLAIGHVRMHVLRAIFSLILTHRHLHHYSRITVLTRDYY